LSSSESYVAVRIEKRHLDGSLQWAREYMYYDDGAEYQILDVGSKLLFRSQSQNALITKQTKIELQNYPAGIYYILVFFKPNSGIAKTGVYKIVKL
jgi:hypothetical protein